MNTSIACCHRTSNMLDVLLSSIALSILYKHAEQTNQRPSNTEAPAELLLVLASCEVSHFYDMRPTSCVYRQSYNNSMHRISPPVAISV